MTEQELREALDAIVIRALAAQQEYAEAPISIYEHQEEPKSEDLVAEILAAIAPALEEKDAQIEHWKDATGAAGERCVMLERVRDDLQVALAEARAAAERVAHIARRLQNRDVTAVTASQLLNEAIRALQDPA